MRPWSRALTTAYLGMSSRSATNLSAARSSLAAPSTETKQLLRGIIWDMDGTLTVPNIDWLMDSDRSGQSEAENCNMADAIDEARTSDSNKPEGLSKRLTLNGTPVPV